MGRVPGGELFCSVPFWSPTGSWAIINGWSTGAGHGDPVFGLPHDEGVIFILALGKKLPLFGDVRVSFHNFVPPPTPLHLLWATLIIPPHRIKFIDCSTFNYKGKKKIKDGGEKEMAK